MGPANDESTAVSQPPSSPVVSGGEEEADGPQSNGPPALRPDDLGRWIIAERG
jgi:hypothetical protein